MNPDASSYGGGNASRVVSVGSETNGLSGTLLFRFGGGGGCDGVERCARAIALSDERPSGVALGLFVGSSMENTSARNLHSLFVSSQETTGRKMAENDTTVSAKNLKRTCNEWLLRAVQRPRCPFSAESYQR